MRKNIILLVFAFLLLKPLFVSAQEEKPKNDEILNLIKELRNSDSNIKTKRIIKRIVSTNISYDSLVAIINSDEYFPLENNTGYTEWNYTLDSLNYTCLVFVPSNYSPQNKYPVSVILHGAVMSLNPISVKKYIKKDSYNTDSLDRIMVYPTGWVQCPWWNEKQINNLNYILRRLKQTYNIDENDVSLAGISDGGTGTVYQAYFNVTPWSNFRPYIAYPSGLSQLSKIQLYTKNLSNKPFLFISSENDQLFPPEYIESFLSKMKTVECNYKYILAKGYKHEISWIPIYEDTISNFIEHNKRNPYPTKLFWQTDNLKYNRNHWVIIDKLSNKEKLNYEEYPVVKNSNTDLKPSGLINVDCEGNIIKVKTINVKQYSLLLSPELFDFNNPIEVYTNGELSFKGKVNKEIPLMLEWFNKDLDRTMLFGTKVVIKLNYH